MASSFSELKSQLGITTLSHKWNEMFKTELILEVFSDENIKDDIYNLYNYIIENRKVYPINKLGLLELGSIAEFFGLILAYFVTDINTIELFFYKRVETVEWFDMFKQKVSRRQFFNLIKSYKSVKKYSSLFDLSTYYQLTPTDKPLFYQKPNIVNLNNEYIVIQYNNDLKSPVYKVLKPGVKFQEFDPEVIINENEFYSLKLRFDDKEFFGESLRSLSNKEILEKKQDQKTCITLKNKGIDFELDSENGILYYSNFDREFESYTLERYKRDGNVKVIFDKELNKKRYVLLSNGFLWNVDDVSFLNLKNIKGFDTLNIELFGLSNSKGVVISLTDTDIEYVPMVIFEKFLTNRLKRMD